MKCPTCGHIHPNGIGAKSCMCSDCMLIWFDEPKLLAPNFYKRRKMLLKKITEQSLKK